MRSDKIKGREKKSTNWSSSRTALKRKKKDRKEKKSQEGRHRSPLRPCFYGAVIPVVQASPKAFVSFVQLPHKCTKWPGVSHILHTLLVPPLQINTPQERARNPARHSMGVSCTQGFKNLTSHKRTKTQVVQTLIRHLSNNSHIQCFLPFS